MGGPDISGSADTVARPPHPAPKVHAFEVFRYFRSMERLMKKAIKLNEPIVTKFTRATDE